VRLASGAKMIDETIRSLEDFDRQTMRLEWAAKLRGDSTAEVVDLVASREAERERLIREHGRSGH